MLSFVKGRVAEIAGNRLVLEVGGLGLELQATPGALALAKVGQEAVVPATLVVREDSWQLFGFADSFERGYFELLQTVSGVGPKLALTILSAIPSGELAQAIANGDEARLVRIPGVGKKSAARLIVELSDRLPKGAAAAAWQTDVIAALRSLGWTAADADWAVSEVQSQHAGPVEQSDALREALLRLGKERGR